MAAKRYWRLVGAATLGGVALELSELRLYEGGVVAVSHRAHMPRTVQFVLRDRLLPRFSTTGTVEAYAEDAEAVSMGEETVLIGVIGRSHVRVLHAARPAPARPEIDQDIFALQF